MKKMTKPQRRSCPTPLPTDRLLTVAAVAEMLQVSERTVRRWIRNGLLPYVRLGLRVIRVREEDVRAAMARGIPKPARNASLNLE
jgi:excisionase family DNA binding protein